MADEEEESVKRRLRAMRRELCGRLGRLMVVLRMTVMMVMAKMLETMMLSI